LRARAARATKVLVVVDQRWIANLSGDPEHGIPADPRGDELRLPRLRRFSIFRRH
jgi:hypothetical protein